jgi:lysophospholipase L1-like esterase
MPRTQGKSEMTSCFAMNPGHAIVALLLATFAPVAFAQTFQPSSGQQWYSAWTAAQADRIVPTTSMNGTSLRMIVRPTISGTAVRVKLENTVGQSAVTFSAVYIGQVQSGAEVEAGSNTQLMFSGSSGLTLAPGQGTYSDPVTFPVTAFTRYAVSLDVTTASDISAHALGLVTNYIAAGPHAADTSAGGFMPVPNGESDALRGPTFPVYWVAAVDVASESNTGTVVALGDSITDGACSTRTNNGAASGTVLPDLYNRWADLLASRLVGLPADQSKAVANEGIAGNRITTGNQPALTRLADDVLGRAGATHLIFLEGTNDIAFGTAAAALIAADQKIIDDVHMSGLKIVGVTIIPRGGDPAWTSTMEQERLTMNDWIRHQGNFDGVIDFDSLLQGPVNSTTGAVSIPSEWSCFDGTHPNSAGHAAMAAFIDLNLFRSQDFSVGFDQSTITTSAGKVLATLKINRTGGFTGTVTVSPPAVTPKGIIPLLGLTPTTGDSVTFKIKVKGSAQPGAHALVFVGKDDSGRQRNATLTLVVQ